MINSLQPITTAPDDGTLIIVWGVVLPYDTSPRPYVAWYDSQSEHKWRFHPQKSECDGFVQNVTHWDWIPGTSDWLPIETAPNNTPVKIRGGKPSRFWIKREDFPDELIAERVFGGGAPGGWWVWQLVGYKDIEWSPTHWKPLPKPPLDISHKDKVESQTNNGDDNG